MKDDIESNYQTSKDYDLLWKLSKEQNKSIVVFVDYSYQDIPEASRDIAKLRSRDGYINISARGIEYSPWYYSYQPDLEEFKKFCGKINLSFIEPTQVKTSNLPLPSISCFSPSPEPTATENLNDTL